MKLINILHNLPVGRRLGAAFAFLSLAMLAIAAAGLAAVQQVNAGLQSVYEDRTVPLEQLSRIDRLLQRTRLDAIDMVENPDAANVKARDAELAGALAEVASTWQAFAATSMTADQRQLAAAFEPLRTAYERQGLQALRDAVKAGNLSEGRRLYQEVMPEQIGAVGGALAKLVQLQVAQARHEYETAQALQRRLVWLIGGVAGGAVLAASGLGFAITRSITRPLAQALDAAERITAGDLTRPVAATTHDEAGRLLAAMGRMQQRLAATVAEIRNGADSVSTASSEIATGNADLSQRTEEQASNLEQTAAAMEQLTATVKNNADTARQAAQLAGGASSVASEGGAVVQRVVSTMDEITQASRRIADIIGTVDGIAFQTNILALNAAVEAARAGEQGRGFAVVASEVRALAQRSAQAAKEIKVLIGASVERVEAGSQLAGDAGRTMDAIVGQVKRVADLIGEITAASAEQSSGIGQVGDAVTQLDRMTQQNAALVEQSAAAAESLKHQAKALAGSVATFKLA